METTISHPTSVAAPSKVSLWAGRVISGICILFLLFDAVCKVIKESHAVSGSTALGIPEHIIPGIGITLLICTMIYIVPRTAIIGAILLTGYLGGATAIMVRADQPIYFSIVFGILVWLGLYLRNDKARKLLL
jgi:hypothetical protein